MASNDHPDNQLTVASNFQKTFSPIHSAGFELTSNHNVQLSSSANTRTSFFTFDTNVLKENDHTNHLSSDHKEDNQDQMTKPLIINTDDRINMMSSNGLNQDDNSNHSSTNSNSQAASSRTFSQMLQTSSGMVKSIHCIRISPRMCVYFRQKSIIFVIVITIS